MRNRGNSKNWSLKGQTKGEKRSSEAFSQVNLDIIIARQLYGQTRIFKRSTVD